MIEVKAGLPVADPRVQTGSGEADQDPVTHHHVSRELHESIMY